LTMLLMDNLALKNTFLKIMTLFSWMLICPF
jgi:hypothetical protein